jgi:hypothetical protein
MYNRNLGNIRVNAVSISQFFLAMLTDNTEYVDILHELETDILL